MDVVDALHQARPCGHPDKGCPFGLVAWAMRDPFMVFVCVRGVGQSPTETSSRHAETTGATSPKGSGHHSASWARLRRCKA